MKDGQVAYSGFPRHEAGLTRGQMVAIAGLIGVAIEIGGLTVKYVGVFGQFHDFGFIVGILANIHHVHNFLAARDRDKLMFHIAQSERSLLLSMFEIQCGGEVEVVRLVLPDMLFDLFEPRSHRQPGGVQPLFIDVDMKLFLKSIAERRDAMIQCRGRHGEHGVIQHEKVSP